LSTQTTTNPVSCLLIDDHPATIDAISRALDGGGVRVVGTADSAATGIAMLERRPADVAVVDLAVPDVDGIAVAVAISRAPSPARTLLYSGNADPSLAGQALAAGVNGLITKSSPLTEVVRAVRAIAAGRTYVDPLVGGPLAIREGPPALSERDELLLGYLSNGISDERIGHELHLSVETVRANIRRVVRSLGARNRPHAIALAMKTGLID
jgi:DNA-binding NarL/FixJ family response regulator